MANFQTLRVIESSAKFIYIQQGLSLNNHRSFRTLEFVEAE